MERMILHNNWRMRNIQWEEYLPATVPGSVYSDLLAAGKIGEPYYRDNELTVLPWMEQDYEYVLTFSVEDNIYSMNRVLLHFDGIDTLADIYLNNVQLGTVNNMHRIWEFDVKPYLHKADNVLRVVFHSPTRYIREQYEAEILDGTSDAMRGFPYLRKAHYMFGWDWGPRIPDAGLWRGVSLLAYNWARIESAYVTQHHQDGQVELSLQACIEAVSGETMAFPYKGDEVLFQAEPEWQMLSCQVEVIAPNGEMAASQRNLNPIVIQKPELWWPSGFGEQPLYTVRIRLLYENTEIDCWERRIGLRTMTMNIEKDEYGESFAHMVNGVSIFAMGADYIPEDNLISRTNPERTRRLLEDAKEAHFNCIRVWGGGYYPEDWFYDACDELGLIVWQDFMFACAVYRLSEDFEENIIEELKDNIKRLRHHASLGLWCGNNEMEMFVKQGEWVNSPQEKIDYVKMYEYIFPKILKEYDPSTFYWPASPSSGGAFDEPNDENRGDVHYWDVWHGNKPFTEYRKFHFRYLSEFGFQSFPGMKTIESFTRPEDRNVYSYVMEKHQRNNAANGKIANYMSQTYLYPTSFETFIYASQLLQAQAMRYGVEHFRRWRGRCMGTVIWQLNDCWPVASWSSIDYYGRWKALHYYEKRFFAPLLLSCEEEGILTQDTNPNAEPYEVYKSIRLNVSNETMQEHTVLIRWELRSSDGRTKRQETKQLTIPALCAEWMERVELPEACLYDDHVYYEMEEGGSWISGGSVLFCPPKYYHFQNPELTCQIQGDTITIRAAAYAKDVEIRNEEENLVLSDNYFDMEPGERTVKILRGNPTGIRLRSTYNIR